jgi:hypothetical protein
VQGKNLNLQWFRVPLFNREVEIKFFLFGVGESPIENYVKVEQELSDYRAFVNSKSPTSYFFGFHLNGGV